MSYTQLLYHIVIRTYRSEHTIPEDHERELYAYMLGIAKRRNVMVYRIGGMPDHVHLFVGIPSGLGVAKFVQELKSITSSWLKDNPHFPNFNHWGKEYAAFTYSVRDKDMIVNYIRGQKEHHRTVTFAEEYRKLIEDAGLTVCDPFLMPD